VTSAADRDRIHGNAGVDSTPVFSIVIPTKEEARYIGRSMRSLRLARERDGLPLEIVVVDGGSVDRTVAEARGMADVLVTDHPLAAHSIAHARNAGAAATSSPFLFHTDADVLIPDLAGLLAWATEAFRDPAMVAVTVPVMPYPWEGTWRDYLIHRTANAWFRASFRFGGCFGRGECQIVRRSAFEAIGGYAGHFISGEDCDLFRRLNRHGRIGYTSDLCVYHSVRRFRHRGYARVLGIYVREWLWMTLLGRSFLQEWPVVR
jgi:glycosyltransferase involved in cell wall biosynthesis